MFGTSVTGGRRTLRTAVTLLCVFLVCTTVSFADDFGPRHDVGTVRADAMVLLAHRARLAHVDPKMAVVSDVVVVGDQALLSWDVATQHGFMGLARQNDRWWDALDVTLHRGDGCWIGTAQYPLAASESNGSLQPSREQLVRVGFTQQLVSAAAAHNRDASQTARNNPRCSKDAPTARDTAVRPGGGSVAGDSGPFGVVLTYSANNALPSAHFSQIYARPPTAAEFLPYPTPYHFISDAVMFFDLVIDAPQPVSFRRGTAFDVWFPFVLDDKLVYSTSIDGTREPIARLTGSVFDNVVHFELPGFTALPGKAMMGEIDGDVH